MVGIEVMDDETFERHRQLSREFREEMLEYQEWARQWRERMNEFFTASYT